MKSFKLYLFVLINFIFSPSIAQTPVGYFIDADRYPVEGYFDRMNYSSSQSLNITHNSDSFEEGYYTDREGNSYEGLIKYENKKFWFRFDEHSKKVKLQPEDVTKLIIGVDSFFTMTNFRVEQKSGYSTRTNPEFAQFICQFNGLIFAKHFNFSTGLAQQYAMASAIIETYQVKKIGTNDWVSFPRRKNEFKRVALEYFGHTPYLKNKIEEEELDYDDMMTIIKISQYQYKFDNNQKVYFDEYWQERSNSNKTKYSGEIVDKQDSIWTINYYQGDTLLFSSQYSSFYPLRRNGTSKIFDKEGWLRQTMLFENNEPKRVSTFYKNGQLHHEYLLLHYGVGDMSMIKYLKVFNESGESLFDSEGNGTEILDDKVNNRVITRNYEKFLLKSSIFRLNGKDIHQLANSNYGVKLSSIQKSLTSFIGVKDLSSAVKDDAQGSILISAIVNEKGYASNCQILTSLHPTVDNLVKVFIKDRLEESATFRSKFKKNKVDKEKVSYEIVIPISFNINRFYRAPSNYYYDPHFQMMHQQMMQQQMLQNIPAPPSRF